MTSHRPVLLLLAFAALLAGAAVTRPAHALCPSAYPQLVAVCEGGGCRALFTIDWKPIRPRDCPARPFVADPRSDNRTVVAALEALRSRGRPGAYLVTLGTYCLEPSAEPRCLRPERVERLSDSTLPQALAAIEAEWRGREAHDRLMEETQDVRHLGWAAAVLLLFLALPWLLFAPWAGFRWQRLAVCVGASVLLLLAKARLGVWFPTELLVGLLLPLWLAGSLRRLAPWSFWRSLVLWLTVPLQLFAAFAAGLRGVLMPFLDTPHPWYQDLLYQTTVVLLLGAAVVTVGWTGKVDRLRRERDPVERIRSELDAKARSLAARRPRRQGAAAGEEPG